MRLFPSAFVLRRKNRVEADAAFREERSVKYTRWRILVPAFVLFCAIDFVIAGFRDFYFYFFLRLSVILFAIFSYYALRGRIGHSMRFMLIPCLPTLLIQVIMIYNGAYFSTYFAGIALILFQGIIYSPKSPLWTAGIYFFTCLPTFIMFCLELPAHPQDAILGMGMLLGTIGASVQHTDKIREYLIAIYSTKRQLDIELRSRNAEVRRQANELVKRKRFESQFSPQVIADVLGNLDRYKTLSNRNICVLVVDICNSTQKASELDAVSYSEVIEEVFDLISASCLKWNLTVDKFTGDGAQAFAGAPKSHPDDLARTTKAVLDILDMLSSRRDYLEFRWGGPVQLKFGICEGEALVGFLGKGALKSYTAIGANVSLAHRLCAEAKPGAALVYSLSRESGIMDDLSSPETTMKFREVSKIKGFDGRTFDTLELKPKKKAQPVADLGRCPECSTPLVLTETSTGLPKLICPSCSLSKTEQLAIKKTS